MADDNNIVKLFTNDDWEKLQLNFEKKGKKQNKSWSFLLAYHINSCIIYLMITDYYGRPIYTERDLVDIYMKNPDQKLKHVYTDTKIEIDPSLEISKVPQLIEHTLA